MISAILIFVFVFYLYFDLAKSEQVVVAAGHEPSDPANAQDLRGTVDGPQANQLDSRLQSLEQRLMALVDQNSSGGQSS